MRARFRSRKLTWCLVVTLTVTLAATSAMAVVYQRNATYNGIWQDWGGGWQYVYWAASDYAAWALNGQNRLAYQYTNGQWWDCDKFSSWRTIGAQGVADWWIGDGAGHNLNNGWTYAFNSSGNQSLWLDNGLVRFSYQYGSGQWWDYSSYGAWNKIGTLNVSGAFVGDGGWHNLNNGWTYAYTSSFDLAAWADNGLARFEYEYGKGQWWDYGTAWNKIGALNVSSAFLGDGALHNLNNGWSYSYNSSSDQSAWADNGLVRFSYKYGSHQWWDYGTAWYAIGATNVSSAFIGDGAWHNLGNGWTFAYTSSADLSTWATGGNARFLYDYGKHQWWNHGNYGSWYALGGTNVSSSFIGDGATHALGIWSYQFVNDIGYLSGSVYAPSLSTGSWGWSTKQFTSSYSSQVLGLWDSGNVSSAFVYSYSGGSPYKWEDWNYYISNKYAISQAIAFYTGSTAHSVSSWLSWLPVNPTAGNITRTETWDFRNNDWDNRFNHEVRAFINKWVVQRAQGSVGNCSIIASIDIFEALTGLYGGYTKYWMDTAVANGWADSGGGAWADENSHLLVYMGNQFNVSMSSYYGTNTARSLSDLASFANQGQKVLIDIDLSYIPAFGSSGLHAVALVGDTYINGVHYAMITNGWNIQSNTTTIAGYDPNPAYPITYIEFSELESAYNAISSSNYAYVRIY